MKSRPTVNLFLAIGILTLIVAPAILRAQVGPTSVVNSPHNLSASGPGTIKSPTEQEVCIFCHTPHHAAAVQPLWNRELPLGAYKPYSSPSLVSTPGQPTGSSKLCLSCHDGTIALGNILSSNQPLQMANGVVTMPQGPTNLGTDLSGDHPISFTYDQNLATQNGELVNPASLPPQVQLEGGQVQCVSCHDPHNDSLGNFLVMSNDNSQLCTSCHVLSGESAITGHDQCIDCHQEHNAPSGALLLNQPTVTATCSTCHGGGIPTTGPSGTADTASASAIESLTGFTPVPGGSVIDSPDRSVPNPLQLGANISNDLNKRSRHETDRKTVFAERAARSTSVRGAATGVTCSDCHEPHSIKKGDARAPNLLPAMGKAAGVTLSGGSTSRARYQYEVCFRCHGTDSSDRPFITRKAVQTNIRLEFSPSAISFHPVAVPGRGHDVPSLIPGMTQATLIYCTDCHNSDSSKTAGGAGPNGPHGSDFAPLLIANYDTFDGSSESTMAYALCYRCHERSSILGNQSFSQHSDHIVNDRTPCAVCHDAHGISSAQGSMRQNEHLINFDTTVVFPDPITKRLEYDSLGPRIGKCYLMCHGKDHSGARYP